MKSPFRRMCAIAASVAALTLVSPAQAQAPVPTPVPIGINNPSCQDVVAICNIQNLVHELVIPDVTTSAGIKCSAEGACTRVDFDPVLGVAFEVRWQVLSDGTVNVDELTQPQFTQQADVPGFEAVIAAGRQGSNAFCGSNLQFVDNIFVPEPNRSLTPTKITFCWASGPCLLSPVDVETACEQYDPFDPGASDADRIKNYLQAHRIAPQQPINVCGCAPEVAQFCEAESCPAGSGIDALAIQGVATTGSETCEVVVISNFKFFIGDTC